MSSSGLLCCDPYNRHKKPISTNLRKIKAEDVDQNVNLVLGEYLCDNCRKYKVPENDLDECCNPFNIHSDSICKALRVIKEIDKERHPCLTVGLLWCDRCRKVSPAPVPNPTKTDSGSEPSSQEVQSSQSSGTTGSPNLSPMVKSESAQRSLQSIGLSLSPLVKSEIKTKGAKVSAVKRKVEEATSAVQRKLTRALGLSEEDVKNDETRKAHDHDLLMDEIKKQLPLASKVKKYQLLSLVPDRLPLREAARQFNVSTTMLDRVRKLKSEQGILPLPNFSIISSVLESTRLLVVNYYCSDEHSKAMPGLRDCVSIGRGVTEQKRLLLSNLPELYESFCKDNKDLKIGLTIFTELRPKWCVYAGQAGTHVQCVCQTHQNIKLILFPLNIKTHYRRLINLCVCDSGNRLCMLRICEHCPNLEDIKKTIKLEIKMPDLPGSEVYSTDDEYDFFDESVKFRQWKSNKGVTEMIAQVCSRSELIETAANQIPVLISHDFIACSQQDYIVKLKENLPSNKVVISMDFSMNYNCLVQGAVQSYHWSLKQATVHPTIVYYKDGNNVLQHKTLIFISDDLDHDVPLVNVFQTKTNTWIDENLPGIEEAEFVTDGCAAQYKSKGYFKNLCELQHLFKKKLSHSYCASGHGKGQNDADGGSVKRKARRASLQRPLENQIISAQDLYQFCVSEMGNTFIFYFVSKTETEISRQHYQTMMPTLLTVPGTRTFHFIKPLSDNKLACWRISKDKTDPPAIEHSLTRTTQVPETLSVKNGMYVVVRLAKNRYVGLVTDVYDEEQEVDMSLLMPKLPTKKLHWPKEIKSATIPLPHCLIEVSLSDSGDTLCFTTGDLEKLYLSKVLKRPQ